MNERTEKAINNIIAILQTQGYVESATLNWTGASELRAALMEFAEGVKLDGEV